MLFNESSYEARLRFPLAGKASVWRRRRVRDREYAFRSLQDQYTFSIRDYTHMEKVFKFLTKATQVAFSPPPNKNGST